MPVDRQGRDRRPGRDADPSSRWDYNALGRPGHARRATRRSTSSCRRPAAFAGVYVQAISAYAPHPNAAKLWMEYLYSDEGQLGWLKGYCHPIRFNDLVARGHDPGRPARQAAGHHAAPSSRPSTRARRPRTLITKQWDRSSARPSSRPDSDRTDRSPTIGDRRRAAARPPGARHRRARVGAASRWTWLGVAPVLHLRAAVPDPARRSSWSSAASTTRPGSFTLQNFADLLGRRASSTAYRISIEISLVTAIAGGALRLPARLRRHPRRPAAVPAADADDLLRRRLELRRRAARLRLHLHARPLGLVTVLLTRPSASTSTARASTCPRARA